LVVTIVIFIIVLAVLILVHEAGHFFVAKWTGMRVDEFGLGFPPKVVGVTPEDSETEYTLNWLPFGGFVQIFGEDLEAVDEDHPDKDRSFANQSASAQIAVLVADVLMNMLLAYLLLSLSFMIGKTVADSPDQTSLKNQRVIITQVREGSPAQSAELETGGQFTKISVGSKAATGTAITPDLIQDFVARASSSPVVVSTKMGKQTKRATITPTTTESGDRQIGIAMHSVGTVTLGPIQAFKRGAEATVSLTKRTAIGFYDLISQAVAGSGGLEQVAGPVGIADFVGDAADRGVAPLFSFVALISINLAILNLLPLPALDGGRIVFSVIEATTGRRIPPRVARWANGIAFALLILLMLVVTYQDILRLF